MKKFIKWLMVVGILILVIVCIDVNFNAFRAPLVNRNQLRNFNVLTVVILVLAIVRVVIIRQFYDKRK